MVGRTYLVNIWLIFRRMLLSEHFEPAYNGNFSAIAHIHIIKQAGDVGLPKSNWNTTDFKRKNKGGLRAHFVLFTTRSLQQKQTLPCNNFDFEPCPYEWGPSSSLGPDCPNLSNEMVLHVTHILLSPSLFTFRSLPDFHAYSSSQVREFKQGAELPFTMYGRTIGRFELVTTTEWHREHGGVIHWTFQRQTDVIGVWW